MSHMEVDGVVVSEPRPGAAEVNARIRELADDRSTQIADWGAHAAAHPEWYQHDDGIHHSTAGRQAYAHFIADQTLALCGHPSPAPGAGEGRSWTSDERRVGQECVST